MFHTPACNRKFLHRSARPAALKKTSIAVKRFRESSCSSIHEKRAVRVVTTGAITIRTTPVSPVLQKSKKPEKLFAWRAKFETLFRARFSRIYYAPAS
jgi:hypothetical protein